MASLPGIRSRGRPLVTGDRWRRRMVQAAALRPGDSVLDVSCGSGRLTALLAERVGPFGRADGVDASQEMVDTATTACRALVQVHLRVVDMLSLPFTDDTFDAATIWLGLRRWADIGTGLRELVRVVRPGGRVVVLGLCLPAGHIRGAAFKGGCRAAAPFLARLLGGAPDAYRDLPRALTASPTPAGLSQLMEAAGLSDVTRAGVACGMASLQRGTVRYSVPGS